MWYKWAIPALILLLSFLIYSDSRNSTSNPDLVPPCKLVRSAKGISMFETSLSGRQKLTITASELEENEDNIIRLKDFYIRRNDGLNIHGNQAEYITAEHLLNISGEVRVTTADGLDARMQDLAWNRQNGQAHTDNPLTVENRGTRIRGNRAEFYDNFSEIRFLGGVNAQINNALFGN